MSDEQIRIEVLAEALQESRARLAELNEAAAEERKRRNECEAALADAMQEQRIEVAGVFFEKGWDNQRTDWKHEELMRDLRVQARAVPRLVDPTTGEIESEWEAAFRVVGDCMSPNWKLTGLKEYGINGNEYCKKERRRKITVTELKEAQQ